MMIDETVHTNVPDNNDDHDEPSNNNDNVFQNELHLVGPDQYNYTDSESTGVIEGDECTEVEPTKRSKDHQPKNKCSEMLRNWAYSKRIRKQNINPDFVYQALGNSNETNDVM